MKDKFQFEKFIQTVVPLGNGAVEMAEDGLFDDCPICQQLRKDLESGKVRQILIEPDQT